MHRLGDEKPDGRRVCHVRKQPVKNVFGDIVNADINNARLREERVWQYRGGTYVAHDTDEWEYENDCHSADVLPQRIERIERA